MNKIKAHFILEGIKLDSEASGLFGEALAKSWLEDDDQDLIDLNKGDQGFFSAELYEKGGKKPDLIGVTDNITGIVLWDAKFHNIFNGLFKLEDEELEKYKALNKYFCEKIKDDDVHVIFMVLPKSCNGNKMYLVHLSQFDNEGTSSDFNGRTATQVKLKDEDCYDTSKYKNELLKKWNTKSPS